MEKIKVNMSPNPLDVQTIHASQNDGEARQWEFELHNNGELIDTSDVKEQLVFKAYKGGTEQLLPENGSTPTTSPFKGDIRYPQGLLTDQEFTYRQSPAEEDGNAKITDIKGNTLNWNQLAENGNFADGVGRWASGGSNTLTVTNGVCKIQSTNTSTTNHHLVFPDPSIFQNGHTYLLRCEARAYGNMIGGSIFFAQQTNYINIGTLEGLESLTSAWKSGYLLFSRNDFTLTNGKRIVIGSLTTVTTDDYFELKNICVFDLTQMGLDITDPSEFTSLFSLPYYDFNQGSLLSFNGNGIKTTGKNLCTRTNQKSNIYNAGNLIPVKSGDVLYYGGVWTGTGSSMWGAVYASKNETNKNNYLKDYNWVGNGVITSATIDRDGFFGVAFSGGVLSYNVEKMMISFAPFTLDEYESYTEIITDIPISTYFPTGMKSAGTAYDELTPKKAITRIGSVDLGSLNWQLERADYNVFLAGVQSYIKPPVDNNTVANIKCALYSSNTNNNVYNYNVDKAISVSRGGALRIRDTSFSDANTFKQSLSGVYLYYEMVAETETSFTTASLVTENAEIPLSNDDGVLIGKCTEELSAEPGFHDAKIKLSDADGECYSNKIQLHVERSPQ